MDSLTKQIEYAIKSAVEEFVELIDQKYEEVDLEELQNIWNNVSTSMKISVSFKKESKTVPKNISSPTDNKVNIPGCPYVFTKGVKKGECCGSKPKTGKAYCSKHTKFEGTQPKKLEELPESRDKPTIRPTQTKTKSEPKPIQRVLRKHKEIGKLWHPESGLVFKSPRERFVIGKCVENKLVSLQKSDLDICKQWGFKIDQEKPIEEEDEEDEEEEEEEVKKIYLIKKSSSGNKKFWEYTIKGCEYKTRFGKVGKEGTSKTKKFNTRKLAIIEMNNSISSKKKNGYIDENATVESSSEDSGINLSELENTIKSLKNSPSKEEEDEDEDEDEEIENNVVGRKFIKKALGLSEKINIKETEEDEDFLLEEEEEEEDE
tara:strand:+ start:623 stop:1747 length:1125 start_codon:yes stop_codon:yes gene_type:complete